MNNDDIDNLEPELKLETEKPPEESTNPQKQTYLPALTLVGALILVALVSPMGSSTKVSSVFGPAIPQSAGERVSEEQRARIDSQFLTYTAKFDPLDFNKSQVQDDFMSASYLDSETKEELLPDLQAGTRRLVSIMLWDNFDQDGDIVRIESAGVFMDIPISHTPVTVLIPFYPGQPLLIQGTHDGGGGITAAIETMSGPVPLPIMSVGQTIILPLL